jgi:NADH:ubiquinone reductase (H+-translocating)
MTDIPQVIILGVGFGGIGALKKLRDADIRITLIDKHDYHTFQPLLYQVATLELTPEQVGFPIRDVLHHHQNVTFHQAVVTSIDTAGREVTMDSMAPLKYDYLVLALGAVVNFFQTPGADQYAFPLYTMEDAARLKEHVLKTFEAVDKNPSLIDDGALNFCVVGGGATGVEVSGALADLVHSELKQDYPNLPVDTAQVIFYEHAPHLLGPFKPELQNYASKALEERGVKVHTGTGVRKVGPASIELANGETVKTHTLIWAAGLKANPIVQSLGVELGHGGRIPVDPDLQVKDHPGVFAIGDIATMTDGETGKPLPGLGATALQAGYHVGETIKRLVEGKTPESFKYVDKGTMAQIGRGACGDRVARGPDHDGATGLVSMAGRASRVAQWRRAKNKHLCRSGLDYSHQGTR